MNASAAGTRHPFVPIDLVREWSRCGQTADYMARYLAYDFADRETAASVLSTVINELVENAAKFSTDKANPRRSPCDSLGIT